MTPKPGSQRAKGHVTGFTIRDAKPRRGRISVGILPRKTKPEPSRAPVRHLSRAHRPETAGSLRELYRWTVALPFLTAEHPTDWLIRPYFRSTEAPASSSFFLIASASSLPMFSFTGFGAPSTRSLASFRPRPVISRTVLITLIFEAPASLRTTLNSVFSSASAAAPPPAAPPPAAATATGAADTPQRSWRNFPNCAISRMDHASSSPASLSNFGLDSGDAVAV